MVEAFNCPLQENTFFDAIKSDIPWKNCSRSIFERFNKYVEQGRTLISCGKSQHKDAASSGRRNSAIQPVHIAILEKTYFISIFLEFLKLAPNKRNFHTTWHWNIFLKNYLTYLRIQMTSKNSLRYSFSYSLKSSHHMISCLVLSIKIEPAHWAETRLCKHSQNLNCVFMHIWVAIPTLVKEGSTLFGFHRVQFFQIELKPDRRVSADANLKRFQHKNC